MMKRAKSLRGTKKKGGNGPAATPEEELKRLEKQQVDLLRQIDKFVTRCGEDHGTKEDARNEQRLAQLESQEKQVAAQLMEVRSILQKRERDVRERRKRGANATVGRSGRTRAARAPRSRGAVSAMAPAAAGDESPGSGSGGGGGEELGPSTPPAGSTSPQGKARKLSGSLSKAVGSLGRGTQRRRKNLMDTFGSPPDSPGSGAGAGRPDDAKAEASESGDESGGKGSGRWSPFGSGSSRGKARKKRSSLDLASMLGDGDALAAQLDTLAAAEVAAPGGGTRGDLFTISGSESAALAAALGDLGALDPPPGPGAASSGDVSPASPARRRPASKSVAAPASMPTSPLASGVGGSGGATGSSGGGTTAPAGFDGFRAVFKSEVVDLDRDDFKCSVVRDFHNSEDMNLEGLKRAKKGKRANMGANASGKMTYQQEDAAVCLAPVAHNAKFGHSAFFGVMDGHVDKNASFAARQLLPLHFVRHLNIATEKNGGVVPTDLREAFLGAFASCDSDLKRFEFEGCTATGVYVWRTGGKRYLQCANVGDSSAFLYRVKKDRSKAKKKKSKARRNTSDNDSSSSSSSGSGAESGDSGSDDDDDDDDDDDEARGASASAAASAAAPSNALADLMAAAKQVDAAQQEEEGGLQFEAVMLSVDHKVNSAAERARLKRAGVALTAHQTRLNGLAVSRSLGDHFAKDNDTGVIGVPYVSKPIDITHSEDGIILVLASDGIWDVLSGRRACEIVLSDRGASAKDMADKLIRTVTAAPKNNDNCTCTVVQLCDV